MKRTSEVNEIKKINKFKVGISSLFFALLASNVAIANNPNILKESSEPLTEVKTVQVETTKVQNKITKFMTGFASYYGDHDGFNGRRMANGDIFNANDMHVAAHPTLPLGTKLKVTDLSNDKVLYVEVTDRMPIHRGRVIDLSKCGAQYLGMHRKGIQKVELTKVTDDEYNLSIGKTA